MEIANKVGAAEIVSRVVDDLKDEAEQYRKMVMETIDKIMSNLGAADIDSRLEEQLIDGILYAFQEQTTEVSTHTHAHACTHTGMGVFIWVCIIHGRVPKLYDCSFVLVCF